ECSYLLVHRYHDTTYHISMTAVQAIDVWVEGSDIICSFDHLFDEEEIRSIVEDPSLSGILSHFPDLLDYVHRIRPEIKLFQHVNSIEDVDQNLPLSGVIGPENAPSTFPHFLLVNGPLEAESAVVNGNHRIAIHP